MVCIPVCGAKTCTNHSIDLVVILKNYVCHQINFIYEMYNFRWAHVDDQKYNFQMPEFYYVRSYENGTSFKINVSYSINEQMKQ